MYKYKKTNTEAYKSCDEGLIGHENKYPRIWLLIKIRKFIPQNLIRVR